MAKDDTPNNKLEWAVSQAYDKDDLLEDQLIKVMASVNIVIWTWGFFLLPQALNRPEGASLSDGTLDRTHILPMKGLRHRLRFKHSVSSDLALQSRLIASGLVASKLEPFRKSDLSKGVFADESDQLGRVWYHIPNLGPKFCDAVRKYSIVANYREAHVVARKRSKESLCMWVGIVGDPAGYTTGSKRHLIEFLLRNPGMNLDQSGSKRSQTRVRTIKTNNPLKKRRPGRRSIRLTSSHGELSEGSSLEYRNSNTENMRLCERRDSQCKVFDREDENSNEVTDDESSQVSTTPSIISIERQGSGGFGFDAAEPTSSSPPIPIVRGRKLKEYALPYAYSHSNMTSNRGDWLDTASRDPTFFALREPPMPSPDAKRMFSFAKNDPPSPVVQPYRIYSVEDLNDLLVKSGQD